VNLLLLVGVYPTFAMHSKRIYKTLTIDNGLPNSTVTGIVQDKTGFVWISTSDGLARFDGGK